MELATSATKQHFALAGEASAVLGPAYWFSSGISRARGLVHVIAAAPFSGHC